MVIACFGQLYIHGREKHPRQLPVTTTRDAGHSEQPASHTDSGVTGSASASAGVASGRRSLASARYEASVRVSSCSSSHEKPSRLIRRYLMTARSW